VLRRLLGPFADVADMRACSRSKKAAMEAGAREERVRPGTSFIALLAMSRRYAFAFGRIGCNVPEGRSAPGRGSSSAISRACFSARLGLPGTGGCCRFTEGHLANIG